MESCLHSSTRSGHGCCIPQNTPTPPVLDAIGRLHGVTSVELPPRCGCLGRAVYKEQGKRATVMVVSLLSTSAAPLLLLLPFRLCIFIEKRGNATSKLQTTPAPHTALALVTRHHHDRPPSFVLTANSLNSLQTLLLPAQKSISSDSCPRCTH